ncbi:VUT family protein [Streptomyces viridodiastaticus]|uniref:VUT family protein n=1 Tax=Streptomyces albogriseolus TaxID=1887 RepID=UPI0022530DCF|nr:VUT family protein [Streptomyces viridodiastaticus]MCX4571587.1 VUT family protein [Streptomyces viridodiastaticus]
MNNPTLCTLTAYVATIPTANLLVTHLNTVPAGFGLEAPAGVFTVGLALVLRDVLHEQAGPRTVWAAIGIGTLVSFLLASDPAVAVASAVAFAVAEAADLAVYTPLRRRGLLWALLASNALGLIVDSLLFLQIAFGDLTFVWGQIVAKAWMTILAAALLLAWVARAHAGNPPEVEECGCRLAQRLLCGHCRHDLCEDCGACTGAGHPAHFCKALA